MFQNVFNRFEAILDRENGNQAVLDRELENSENIQEELREESRPVLPDDLAPNQNDNTSLLQKLEKENRELKTKMYDLQKKYISLSVNYNNIEEKHKREIENLKNQFEQDHQEMIEKLEKYEKKRQVKSSNRVVVKLESDS